MAITLVRGIRSDKIVDRILVFLESAPGVRIAIPRARDAVFEIPIDSLFKIGFSFPKASSTRHECTALNPFSSGFHSSLALDRSKA